MCLKNEIDSMIRKDAYKDTMFHNDINIKHEQ